MRRVAKLENNDNHSPESKELALSARTTKKNEKNNQPQFEKAPDAPGHLSDTAATWLDKGQVQKENYIVCR